MTEKRNWIGNGGLVPFTTLHGRCRLFYRRSGGGQVPIATQPRQRTAAPISEEELYFDTDDVEEQSSASSPKSPGPTSNGGTGTATPYALHLQSGLSGGVGPTSQSVPIVAAPLLHAVGGGSGSGGGGTGGYAMPTSPQSPGAGRPSSPPLGGGHRSPTFAGFALGEVWPPRSPPPAFARSMSPPLSPEAAPRATKGSPGSPCDAPFEYSVPPMLPPPPHHGAPATAGSGSVGSPGAGATTASSGSGSVGGGAATASSGPGAAPVGSTAAAGGGACDPLSAAAASGAATGLSPTSSAAFIPLSEFRKANASDAEDESMAFRGGARGGLAFRGRGRGRGLVFSNKFTALVGGSGSGVGAGHVSPLSSPTASSSPTVTGPSSPTPVGSPSAFPAPGVLSMSSTQSQSQSQSQPVLRSPSLYSRPIFTAAPDANPSVVAPPSSDGNNAGPLPLLAEVFGRPGGAGSQLAPLRASSTPVTISGGVVRPGADGGGIPKGFQLVGYGEQDSDSDEESGGGAATVSTITSGVVPSALPSAAAAVTVEGDGGGSNGSAADGAASGSGAPNSSSGDGDGDDDKLGSAVKRRRLSESSSVAVDVEGEAGGGEDGGGDGGHSHP